MRRPKLPLDAGRRGRQARIVTAPLLQTRIAPDDRARCSDPALLGSAYRSEAGPIYLLWPDGSATCTRRESSEAQLSRTERGFDLIALGLSRADLEAIEALWPRGSDLSRHRLAREAEVLRRAAPAARRRAASLRGLRKAIQPRASVSLAMTDEESAPEPLVRFRNGRGWWCDGCGGPGSDIPPEYRGWDWEAEDVRCVTEVLAEDLSDEELLELAALAPAEVLPWLAALGLRPEARA
jgi:hypothetical protein